MTVQRFETLFCYLLQLVQCEHGLLIRANTEASKFCNIGTATQQFTDIFCQGPHIGAF